MDEYIGGRHAKSGKAGVAPEAPCIGRYIAVAATTTATLQWGWVHFMAERKKEKKKEEDSSP